MRRRKLSEKIIASALCAVMAFGNVNVSTIFASETADPSIEVASEVTAEQESAPVADEPVLMTAEEPEEAPLVEPEPTEVITPEPTPETVVEPQPTEEAPAAEPKPTEAAPETVKEPAEEPKAPETTPVTEETVTEEDEEVLNEEVLNEAVQLKKEFQDGYGNHIRITADIQAESFQAEASAITMEVKGLSPSEDTYMQNMIEEKLPEDMVLGDYIFYDIAFKVNGQVTEPMKAIRITFAGNKLPVEDTEKANVVYLDYADPTIPGDKNEIVEIPQKKDLVKAGWTAAQIEEQDVSEIFMNADGTADQIQMEGNDSTIYGCYVEKEPQLVFTHEDDDVKITVSAEKKGIIPEGVSLNVVPILKDAAETTEKYSEVEAQLQKKAENEEYDIAGFLAYDISFVNENGEEVEPNGDVNVAMEYKKETLPEEIEATDDELDVTVMHLEENADGEVQAVVDLTENEQLKAIKTTEEQQIQKAEFVTSSFSTYTVTWMIASNRKVEVTAHYGYEEGGQFKEFTEEATKKLETITTTQTSNNVCLADYSNIDVFQKDGYTFQNTYISENNNYGDKNESTYLKLTRSGRKGSYTYNLQTSTDGNIFNNYGNPLNDNQTRNVDVYYVYEKIEPLATVPTVDHNKDGIIMRMINYGTAANGINIGGGYGDGTIKKNLLQSVLENGYPRTAGGTNLSSLFNGGTQVNHLFREDIYNSTGYYEYSSFENYAYLNGTDFKVYNGIGTPSDSNSYFYQRGNFMPYNDIVAGKYSATNRNWYDENGNRLQPGDPRYGERLYDTQGTNDFYFGMYMEAKFAQLKDGKTERGDTMKYEFNGDDDMWIYIDDVLVLDIGGIHDAHSGSIDFATGIVSWTDCKTNGIPATSTTTIKEMFRLTGKFPDGTTWDNSKVDDYFKGDTFKDYTAHTFKMFYMERGAGASNLHMKMNLPTIPEGMIEVRKELTNTDKEKYSDVEFAFQVWAQKVTGHDSQGNELYSDEYELLNTNAVYKGTDTPVKFTAATFGDKQYDNVFYLKPDQAAQFTDLQKNRKYYVVEVGVNAQEYDTIIINGVEYKKYNENDQNTGTITDIETDKEPVGDRPLVVCENNCSAYNHRELKITKQMAAGQTTEDTFRFKIRLSGQNGELIDYANDSYYLKDASGNYYYYDEKGELVSNGTNAKECGKTSSQGIVSGVPAGYTVVLTGILSGTRFEVKEVGLDENIYSDPVVTVAPTTTGTAADGIATGTVELGKDKDVQVTVTNSYKKNTVPIDLKKFGTTYYNPVAGAKFKLYKGVREEKESAFTMKWDANPIEEYEEITVDNSGSPELNLNSGYYKMEEVMAPTGYQRLETPIYFRVDVTDTAHPVSYINGENGEILTSASASQMWKINETNNTEIDVLNEIVYDLPSTGGNGIYWYMISGVLLMLAGALILYKIKRGEVLRS